MIDDTFDAIADLPWPQKGDVLFANAEDWYHNACLNWRYDNWELYASGYKTAGDVLVQHVIDTRSERDILVFPIVFNYRQYIELRCKEIIRLGRMLSDMPGAFPQHHDLQKLWSVCRKIISDCEPGASKSDFEAIDELIAQFCAVDAKSENFRYPVDRAGNPAISDALPVINLRQLRDVMNRLASFLDGVSMAFSVYIDNRAEMQGYGW